MPSTIEVRPARAERQPLSTPAYLHLTQKVETVRWRHRLNWIVSGMLCAALLFGCAFLVFSLADVFLKLTDSLRIVFLLSTIAALSAAFALSIVRPWLKQGNTLQVARKLEQQFPQLDNQLSTALEYAHRPLESSPELVEALLKQSQARTEALDLRRSVSWRSVFTAGLLALAVALFIATYGLAYPRLFSATWSRFIHPFTAIAPPSLTVIQSVEPGSRSFPSESDIPIAVTLNGRIPGHVTLWLMTSPDSAVWEERELLKGEDGRYYLTLRRLMESAYYRVVAGDARSELYEVDIYREPRIDELNVTLTFPEYTQRAPEPLPPGEGKISALKGTLATVRFVANTPMSRAELKSEPLLQTEIKLDPNDARRGDFAFTVESDGTYSIELFDIRGRSGPVKNIYRIEATADQPPRVRIVKPEKDLMVHREQSVAVEIDASDDIGVKEIGIFHSLGLEEQKVLIKRFDQTPRVGAARLKWELGQLPLKGGEVIVYYAYALDADTHTGPKIAKSQLHFLTVYDDDEYENLERHEEKKQPRQPTPESVKSLDKMIDLQKKLLQETFGQARLRESELQKEPTADPSERLAKNAIQTAASQRALREQLNALIQEIRAEVEKASKEGLFGEKPTEETPPGPEPEAKPPTQMGEKELKHLELAAELMQTAAQALEKVEADKAVNPEIEALRNLSETRRLLLSDQEGDPRFRSAMEQQSRRRRQQNRTQEEQDRQQAREELSQLPPMMERQKELDREVERLEARKPRQLRRPDQPPPTEAEAQQEKQEQEQHRQLKRKIEDELQRLTQESQRRSQSMRDLAERNEQMRSAAEQMQQAAEKFEQARQQLDRDRLDETRQQMQEARNRMENAQRSMRNALEQQLRDELQHLQNDAQTLSASQNELNERTRQEQAAQQSQQQNQTTTGSPSSASERTQQNMQRMAQRQAELQNERSELNDRLQKASTRLREERLPGGSELDRARQLASDFSETKTALDRAQDALREQKTEAALREQEKASRGLEAIEQALQAANRQLATHDMQALREALQQAGKLRQEQEAIVQQIDEKRDPADTAARQNQLGSNASQLKTQTEKLEALKSQNLDRKTQEHLEEAEKHATESASALSTQQHEQAQEASRKAAKALQSAVNAMERAAGKSLQDRANEVRRQALEAAERQEQAAQNLKQAGEAVTQAQEQQARKSQHEASTKTREAHRMTERLNDALEGLQQTAAPVNPAAAKLAAEAKAALEKENVLEAMQALSKRLEQQSRQTTSNPSQEQLQTDERTARKLAEQLKQLQQQLDAFVAEATNDELSRLQHLEKETREAQRLSQTAADASQESASSETTRSDKTEERKKLQERLERLADKLQHRDDRKEEQREIEQALQALQDGRSLTQESANPSQEQGKALAGGSQAGGRAYRQAEKHLRAISRSLNDRIERILKAREIRPEADERTPKAYQDLSDRYYRALSEDVEE